MSDIKYLIEKYKEKFFLWFIWKLPHSIVVWCYIRVVSARGDCPPWYQETLKIYEEKTKTNKTKDRSDSHQDSKVEEALQAEAKD